MEPAQEADNRSLLRGVDPALGRRPGVQPLATMNPALRLTSRSLTGLYHLSLCVLVFALCGLRSAAADQATGAIQGRVFNAATGKALANARVTVQGGNLTAVTDEIGAYRVAGVPAGPARISVAFVGMQSVSATLNILADGTVQREFELALLGTPEAGLGRGDDTVKLSAFTVVAEIAR